LLYNTRNKGFKIFRHLLKGLAQLVGMKKIEGPQTIKELFERYLAEYDNYDFFFIHFKYTDKTGEDGLSQTAWDAISKILNHAQELSLILNSSVNAYRRLDPHFEAPNQIKVSSIDRGAMVRIPAGNETSARIEIRSVGPDANPYLALYALLETALNGEPLTKDESKRDRVRYLPGNIYDAIRIFRASEFIKKALGAASHEKYVSYKQAAAERSPKELGGIVKSSEVLFHHDVTNQMLWHKF